MSESIVASRDYRSVRFESEEMIGTCGYFDYVPTAYRAAGSEIAYNFHTAVFVKHRGETVTAGYRLGSGDVTYVAFAVIVPSRGDDGAVGAHARDVLLAGGYRHYIAPGVHFALPVVVQSRRKHGAVRP